MGEQELHIVLLSNDPERAYPAFQLAMGAAAMGHKARVYATTAGLDLLQKGGRRQGPASRISSSGPSAPRRDQVRRRNLRLRRLE